MSSNAVNRLSGIAVQWKLWKPIGLETQQPSALDRLPLTLFLIVALASSKFDSVPATSSEYSIHHNNSDMYLPPLDGRTV